jgi:hypothetical protein
VACEHLLSLRLSWWWPNGWAQTQRRLGAAPVDAMIEPGAQRRRCRLLCVATFFDRRLSISFKKPARMCLADDFFFYFIGLG